MDFLRKTLGLGDNASPLPPQQRTTIFGGTNRSGEESVGSAAPAMADMKEKNDKRAIYQTDTSKTVVIPGPGITGGPMQKLRELIIGQGPTGMMSNTQTALQEDNPPSQQHKAIGYSRGAVSAEEFAKQRAQRGLETQIDLRDPVSGGRSSIEEVSDKVKGRIQVSLDNDLPGFGATLLSGPEIATVVTPGGHDAFARSNFTKKLPQGVPGKVSLFDGEKDRVATRDDSAQFRRDVDQSRQLSIHDGDSAMNYHFGLDVKTTDEDRRSTIANLIDKSNSEWQ